MINSERYKKFEQLQEEMALVVDKFFPIDTPEGNEVLIQMGNAAFEVLEKYELPEWGAV